MKRNLFFITLLCGGLAFAQTTGKVGVQTDNPTETLDVKGTVRVQTLPKDGAKGSINTPSANSDFKATKTVVVDDKGVLGVVEGLPVTELPDTKVKTIQYATKTAVINGITPQDSELELGNIAVRYNGTEVSGVGDRQTISFKLINDITDLDGNVTTQDNVICNVQKVGSGGAGYGGQKTFFSAALNQWNEIKGYQLSPNLDNNDFAVYNIALLNTREVYRLTVSLNRPITERDRNVNNSTFVPSAAQVTFFLERLTNHVEKASK